MNNNTENMNNGNAGMNFDPQTGAPLNNQQMMIQTKTKNNTIVFGILSLIMGILSIPFGVILPKLGIFIAVFAVAFAILQLNLSN